MCYSVTMGYNKPEASLDYLLNNGISIHETSCSKFPQSNWFVEGANQTIKNILQKFEENYRCEQFRATLARQLQINT